MWKYLWRGGRRRDNSVLFNIKVTGLIFPDGGKQRKRQWDRVYVQFNRMNKPQGQSNLSDTVKAISTSMIIWKWATLLTVTLTKLLLNFHSCYSLYTLSMGSPWLTKFGHLFQKYTCSSHLYVNWTKYTKNPESQENINNVKWKSDFFI